MPVTLGLITAGIGAGTSIYGAIQKDKAQKAAANNIMPKYNIPQEEYDALNLAKGQANMGMGGAARQNLQNNTDRSLATATNATLMGGGDANTIGNIVDKSQEGYNQAAMYDDQVRLSNLRNLQSSYGRMSANRDKQWQINEYAPWANKAQALAGQIQGAQSMETSGMNMLGGGLAGIGNGLKSMGNGNPNLTQTPSPGGNSGYSDYGFDPSFMNYGGGRSGASGINPVPYGGNSMMATGPQQGNMPSFSWNGFYPNSQ